MTTDKALGQCEENIEIKSLDSSLLLEANDQEMIDEIENIRNLLSQNEPHHLDFELDKQIIAAAYRDINESHKKNSYQLSWWRKITLPLYVAAGFTLTILAYSNLWPTLPYIAPNDTQDSAAMRILIDGAQSSKNSISKTSPSASPTSREKILLPAPFEAPSLPGETIEGSKMVAVTPINKSTNEVSDAFEQKQESYYTGSQLVKAEFPEKESWARKIIDYMRGGQFELAKTELRKFKDVYPSYPIEEQIKALSQ